MPFCSSLLIAQQTDRSVLVFENSNGSAGSNAQVEIEDESLPAASSWPSFGPPASNQHFLPPSPPTSMNVDSNDAANFRLSTQGKLSAAPPNQTITIQPAVELGPDDHESVQVASATLSASDAGTFVSRLPSDAESDNDSGLQAENSFGSSPAQSSLRPNPASSSTRNRFGDFGEPTTPKVASRFAPIGSNQRSESPQNRTAPPSQPTSNRFASPSSASANAQKSVESGTRPNRFGPPASATSQRFSQPASPESGSTPPSRLAVSQPITTHSISEPPAVTRPPSQPQSTSQTLTNPSSPPTSNRFASAPSTTTNPAAVSSLQSGLRPPQSNSFGNSSSSGDSVLRSTSNTGSRRVFATGAGLDSKRSEPSSNPMIRREASSSSSSSSSTSFSNSSGIGQSNTGTSRLAQQTSGFTSQSGQQPLRGRPVNSGNDLRNNSSNTQTPTAQRSPAANQASDKADRNSINFARQQIRSIQPTSATENGTPVRLQEMFLEPLTGSQRKQMVAQYWETYYDLAALKIASDYEGWLNSISTSGAEKGLLNAAQQMAADDQLAAKIQLGKSQSRLLDFMPNPRPNEFAPLPADQPLVEHYVTDYEKYKRVRSLPTSLRGIDPMLASTLKLITQRAETVSTAKNAADQAGQSVRNQQLPLTSAIATGQLWRDARLDMVASTVSYNQAISDFVLTLEPNRSPEQLTAFMLGAPENDAQSSARNPQNQNTRSAATQPGFPPNRQRFR